MKHTCRDYQNMVQPFIQHQLNDSDLKEFLEHIHTCKKCADELETYFIVDYSLHYLDNDTAHSDNIQSLLEERIRAEEHDLRLRRIFRIIIPVFLGLLILLAAVMILNELYPELTEPVYHWFSYWMEELWRIK